MELYKAASAERVAIIDEVRGKFTYAQLSESVHVVATELQKFDGLVFNLCSNTYQTVINYNAILQSKKCAQVLLPSSISKQLLEQLIEIYKPQVILGAEQPNLNSNHYERFKALEHGGEFLSRKFSEEFIIHDDLAVLIPTSGTTGSPKLVKLSYQNLLSNARSISSYLDIDEGDRAITTLPFNYAFGLSIINSHLYSGASIALTNSSISEKKFWHFFEQVKPTSLSGVPYTYQLLLRFRLIDKVLKVAKTLTQAGGKLAADLVVEVSKKCKAANAEFFVMYGQTEATARMSYLPPELAMQKPNSIGLPIPNGELKIISSNGKTIIKPGVSGELVYKGKNVCMGYAESIHDLSLGDVNHGILATGDIAEMDEQGMFNIIGRSSRFVKIAGNRVSLDELETILAKEHIACACFGEDDSVMIVCEAELSAQQDISKRVSDVFINTIFIHKSQWELVFVECMQRTESGKIDYKAMAQVAKSI